MALIKIRSSRVILGCALGIGLALLLLCPLRVWGQEGADKPVNLDVILLIDNSMSMSQEDPETRAPPSDPEELRIQAAKFLVDYLRANAETTGANHRVGVVSFGGQVSDVIPLRLLQDDAVREGIRAEEIEFTDFRGPLQFALREFRAKSFSTGNEMAVILFTDSRPQLTATPMIEQELRAYFEDLAPLVGDLRQGGASLFVLGIGDAQKDRNNWTQFIPEEHYVPIDSTTVLPDVTHRIVADLIGVTVFKEETLPAGQAASVTLGPYLERVAFSFMKSDPAVQIVLISPAGAMPTPTMGGTADVHHAVYSIADPDAGEWSVLWEGEEGEVRYWVDKQSPLIRVEPIASPVFAGQPITVTASLVRNGEIVEDPDLHLEAQITPPDGEVVTRALAYVGGGSYTGSYDVEAEGTHTVTAKATLDDQLLSVRAVPMMVEVFPPPALPTPTPQPTTIPTSEVAAPTPTVAPAPTTGLGTWSRIGSILLPIVVGAGLGIASWFLYVGVKRARRRDWPETLDRLRKATSRRQIERIIRPIERAARAAQELGENAPWAFAIKILKVYVIEGADHADQELKRYAGSEIVVERVGAGIAARNLLMREDPHRVLPRLRTFIGLGCDGEILEYAQNASTMDVPGLKEVDGQRALDIGELCRIYSGLCDEDEPRLPELQTDVKRLFKRYGAEGSFALLKCVRDSGRPRKGRDVIPIRVSPQLHKSGFAAIPQLRPLRDILLQFEGVKLYPLHTEHEDGFLNLLESARRRLSELEEGAILPEWRVVARLFESWRAFIERELSEERARAKLVVKPVTRCFPRNVGPGDVDVAWVLYNEGPSFAEIHQIALYLDGRELARDTKGELLRCGDRRRVAFTLGELEGSKPPAELDLEVAVSLSDRWERRTERVLYPHHGFEVLGTFQGDVIGGEVVGLLHSNEPLTAEALRRYCLGAKLCVHCNQLALLRLLEYSGGYPLFAHILLDGLIRYLRDGEEWRAGQPRYVTCADVPKVVEYIIDWEVTSFPGLIAEAWDGFPSDERAAIEALVKSARLSEGEPASLVEIQTYFDSEKPVAPILERLETKGLVERGYGRYRLRARLLEEWVSRGPIGNRTLGTDVLTGHEEGGRRQGDVRREPR